MALLVTVLKWAAAAAAVVWGGLALLDWIGPTEPADLTARFDAAKLGDDLDLWLAEQEAQVPNLRDNAAKMIVWAGEPGERTDLALVYLHGFSATREELRPLPDLVAAGVGANLYFARLTGHGQDGAALGEARVADWMADVAEAMAIGRRLGDRVILMGNSTGSTLAIAVAADPALRTDLAGVILMSPNLGVSGLPGRALEWPYVRTWGPMLIGPERSFTPRNDGHAKNWTTSYPSKVLAALGALTHEVRGLDFSSMIVPAIFFVSNEDQVVDPKKSRQVAGTWGAPSDLVPVVITPADDPGGHILAGDILSPKKTAPVSERILFWARGL
ncbi:MAG: alpha/beta fold hydrolase [Rhodobacteraceae bacterium]|nr:alpha/beta fold hydrolase [Paracoccaceae bacterium]